MQSPLQAFIHQLSRGMQIMCYRKIAISEMCQGCVENCQCVNYFTHINSTYFFSE